MKKTKNIIISSILILAMIVMPVLMTGCFDGGVADVELNAVYYHENSDMGDGNDYVKFISEDYMLMTVFTSANFEGKPAIAVTKTITDNKVIYSGSIQEGVTFTITVVDKNILTMSIVINGDVDNCTTFNLTKLA